VYEKELKKVYFEVKKNLKKKRKKIPGKTEHPSYIADTATNARL